MQEFKQGQTQQNSSFEYYDNCPWINFMPFFYNQYQWIPHNFQISGKEEFNSIDTSVGAPQKTQAKESSCIKKEPVQNHIIKVLNTEKKDQTLLTKLKDSFLYFDPHQAPALTFGIEDVQISFKKEEINNQMIDKQVKFQQKVHNNDFDKNRQMQRNEMQLLGYQFKIYEPDPSVNPFLIIKKRTSFKRKYITYQQFEKRAQQIQAKRIKNLQRLQIEERIGKKLPVKNKKWKRKKNSLVFDARGFKKKILNSQKSKNQQNKQNKLSELFAVHQ